jgi:anti-sigma-K factor RskA
MNEHVEEALALYALGGLEPDEARAVERHLPMCAACQVEVKQHQALVALVAASVPEKMPSRQLRSRVLATAGAAGPNERSAERAPRQWLAIPRWLATGLALLLAVLAGWNVYLTRQLGELRSQLRWSTGAVALISRPSTQTIALAGQGEFTMATGEAYVDGQSRDVVLIVRQLAPPEPDETYQAWIITDRGPVSAGLFETTANGWGMTWLEAPFAPGSAIGVSVEPLGGSAEPTEVVLLSDL